MSRLPVFDSPLLLGFDHFERIIDQVAKSSDEGYPPYNIEQIDDESLRITLAVAGFSMDDLEVTTEDNQLVIKGRNTDVLYLILCQQTNYLSRLKPKKVLLQPAHSKSSRKWRGRSPEPHGRRC